MKQFNLEEYLKNHSRKVVTRCGKNARIICTDAKNVYSVVALIAEDKSERVETYLKDGRYSESRQSSDDLFFAPENHEGWVNIYKSQGRLALFTCGLKYDSEEEARREAREHADITAIATVKIEWEE